MEVATAARSGELGRLSDHGSADLQVLQPRPNVIGATQR